MDDPRAGTPATRRIGGAEAVAAAISVLWLVGAVAVLAGSDGAGGPVRFLGLVAALVPVVLVWVAVVLLRTAQALRAEAARLQATLEAMRQSGQAGRQSEPRPAAAPAVPSAPLERRLDDLLAAQVRLEGALARVTDAQEATAYGFAEAPAPAPAPPDHPYPERPAVAPPPPERQAALALGDAEGVEMPVALGDLLRALNFPDTLGDAEGFRALRAALADPRAARVIRAAQDVLTLISEDGIYMDDLPPEPANPELWRRFARGERGGAIVELGAVRDEGSLARASARMREDAVFRDVAHHFLRHFDRMLEALEPQLTDADIAQMAETRSGRVFTLLGRVTGMFG